MLAVFPFLTIDELHGCYAWRVGESSTEEGNAVLPPRHSKSLSALGLKHKLGVCPRDGNCFYHACAHLLRIKRLAYVDHAALRKQVADSMDDEERCLSQLLDVTQSGWADNVQINAFAKLYGVALIVVDDAFNTLTFHGDSTSFTTFVLLLHEAHYVPVLCQTEKLRGLFSNGQICVSLDAEDTKNKLKRKHWSLWPCCRR